MKKSGRITNILPSFYEDRPAIIEGNIAKIPIGSGAKDGYVIVDKKFAALDKYKWYLCSTGYAKTYIEGKKPKIHQLIFPARGGLIVDHKDGDPLNNRMSNLRLCTQSENMANTRRRSNNTSGYKGVTWDKKRNLWLAQIRKEGKSYHLGRFSTIKNAKAAYDKKAIELNGSYARLS